MSKAQPTRSETAILDDNMETEADPLSASVTQINHQEFETEPSVNLAQAMVKAHPPQRETLHNQASSKPKASVSKLH